jgi:hypothetical protein
MLFLLFRQDAGEAQESSKGGVIIARRPYSAERENLRGTGERTKYHFRKRCSCRGFTREANPEPNSNGVHKCLPAYVKSLYVRMMTEICEAFDDVILDR